MVVLFIILVAVILILSAPSYYYANKQNNWFKWDYGLCIAPLAFWFLLVAIGIGPQSLANLIELIIIGGIVPILLAFRIFFLDKVLSTPRRNSIIIFVLCMIIPIILRLTMPLIPE